MKKLVAFLLSAMMVISMTAVGMMYVAAEGTGSLTITKKIEDTTKSDPADKVGLNGVTYNLYQVFAKTENGYQITKHEYVTALAGYTANLTPAAIGENTYATYGSTNALEGQIGNLLAVTTSATVATKTGTTATVSEQDGVAAITDIPYGVYLVVETGVPTGYTFTEEGQPFLVNIFNNTTVNAVPKNQKHPLTKDIVDTDNSLVNSKSFQIGDTVPYEVNTSVPNYNVSMIQGLKTQEAANAAAAQAAHEADESVSADVYAKPFSTIPFTFTDTLSNGLTLNVPTGDGKTLADAFTIKVGSGASEKTLTKDTEYTVTENPTRTYKIDIKFAALYTDEEHNYLNAPVKITYSATLNKDAVVTDGNLNTIKLNFKNNPSIDTATVEFSNTDVDPKAYTYQMEMEKLFDGKTIQELLADGVTLADITKPTFTLYNHADCAANHVVKVAETVTGTAGSYVLDATGNGTLALTDEGKLTVKGLKAGIYYLKENGSPRVGSTNYTPLGAAIAITVEDVKSGNELTGVVKAYLAGAESTDLMIREEVDHDAGTERKTGKFAFTVNNPKSQFDIPETGGYGILIFTLGAAVVLAGAVIIFILARKKKTEK